VTVQQTATAEPLYRPTPCRIERVGDLTPTEKLFRLVRKDGCSFGHRPGQFVQVSLLGHGEAPISVSSSPTRGDYLELGVRNAGDLTGALHRLPQGSDVGVRGPFGTRFDTEAMRGRDVLLIAGGVGLAPLRSLVQYCEDRRTEFDRVVLLAGSRTPRDMLYREEVAAWRRSTGLECHATVDAAPDGQRWDGEVGVITKLIPPLAIRAEKTTAVICGPPVMYKFVIQELRGKGMKTHDIVVSLERHMKCGVGKCGHCAIEHLYCCLDGPVFPLDRIGDVWGALA
jgi:NAD(P)H-flavin reductase